MIGVFGGSFDPIHFGHIEPLNELSEIFDFEEIRLIPTYKSPVKKPFYASADHRYRMAAIIASSGTNNFISDDIEIRKEGISYTHETIKIIKKERNEENLCLIIGLDVFLNIETWYNYLEILKEANKNDHNHNHDHDNKAETSKAKKTGTGKKAKSLASKTTKIKKVSKK